MTYEEIDKELENFEGDVFFVNLLNQFVWSQTDKRVAGYHEYSSPDNKLIVMDTVAIDLKDKPLLKFLEKEEVTNQDVLVFCINQEFYPKTKGNWILLNVIKNVNKRKSENRRKEAPNATEGISGESFKDTALFGE